jgi:hypothetical protein
MSKFLHPVGAAIIAFSGLAAADPEILPLRAMASAEFGRLENVFIAPSEIYDKESLINGSVWMFQGANLNESFDAHFGIGVMTFSVIDRASVANAQFRRMVPVLARASGIYTLGGRDESKYPFRAEVGIFPYKYNSFAANLGEYMFRTRVMPIQVRTGGLDVIESAGSLLTGFHLDGHIPGGFHWDAFYTYNMDRIPLKAQSVTLMAGYKHQEVFEFGVGLQWENWFFDNDSLLSPKITNNMSYKAVDAQTGANRNFNYKTLDAGLYDACAPGVPEPCPANSVSLDKDGQAIGRADLFNGGLSDTLYRVVDSSYYSFNGVKVMARAALNLQSLLQLDFLGPKDLSVYSEAILLGLEPVPVYGETLKERIPVMFGVNLPTFKLLDQLTLEMELFRLRYPMSDKEVQDGGEVPNYEVIDDDGNFRKDDWKFSLFAKKSITRGFEVYLQVARDHMRTIDFYGKENYWEVTQRNGKGLTDLGDFYWLTRFKYYF